MVSLKKDYITPSKTTSKGNFAGIGASFNTNLFRKVNEATRFRSGDYEGLGLAAGAGGKGLWYQVRADLGWQFHYAPGRESDCGLRLYATGILDKIPFYGVMIHPSVKLHTLYFDYVQGIFIKTGTEAGRTYSEFNFRYLVPSETSDDMDRWYFGFKAVSFKGVNSDPIQSTTRMNQGYITLGLML